MFLFVCSRSPCGPQYDYHTSLLAEIIRAIKLLFRYIPMTTIGNTCSQHDLFLSQVVLIQRLFMLLIVPLFYVKSSTPKQISCNLKIGILNKTQTQTNTTQTTFHDYASTIFTYDLTFEVKLNSASPQRHFTLHVFKSVRLPQHLYAENVLTE